MIGIVIVSHSAKLAEGIRDLTQQITQGRVAIAVAGGIDDPDNPIGTDALKIVSAIESIYQSDDILVMMDLGSALLSAEMALEFLSPAQQAKVHLCSAAIVEGTIAAAVQASVGSNIQQVIAEAEAALNVKINQLGRTDQDKTFFPAKPEVTTDTQQLHLTVQNVMGLHARPAANLVKTASQYKADIWVYKNDKSANANSINQIAMLAVRQGEEIVLSATGKDADAALEALKVLAENNFDAVYHPREEKENFSTLPSLPTKSLEDNLVGIPVSPGIAIGPVIHFKPHLPEITTQKVADVQAECDRLQIAITKAITDLKKLQDHAVAQMGNAEATIFEAQALLLQDPMLIERVTSQIVNTSLNAEAAWSQVIETIADEYRNLDDAYISGRAADILDVGQCVLRYLLNVERTSVDLKQPSIIIARNLTPSDTARLNPATVLGLCTELGGATSHSAILAHALSIPTVVGLNGILADITEGQIIALDGSTGQVWLSPNETQLTQLEMKRKVWLQERKQAQATAQQLARTKDGQAIEVAANISGPKDMETALEFGAEGVGLFRTEFLFLDRDTLPSEEEQFEAYQKVAHGMGNRPVIIRTIDIGGDKPLPYLDLDYEDNPFFGWRGIRFCLDHPDIFKTQLRAILRASFGHNIKLMFPMIGTLTELQAAKTILAEVQEELRVADIPFDDTMEVGIMIEVPSAVIVADQLAAEVDFFSIGSNDLTQYVMATDRGNGNVANLANALHPAILRLIQQTTQAAQKAGIWVGMCGELAGNALATPILIGLGLNELSMNSPNIPAVKSAIRKMTLKKAQGMAAKTLNLTSGEAVQDYLESMLKI